MFVAVDAKDYSKQNAVAQAEMQSTLIRLLDEATHSAGLDRVAWSRQPQGDGELALVPPDQSEDRVVDAFIRELDALLDRYNRDRLPESRLRLRVALHFGIGSPAENGYAGRAPILVSRLLASDALHAALASTDDCDLAVALSDTLYEDVILNGFTSLRPEAFAPYEIVTDKFRGRAWIRTVLRHRMDPGSQAPDTDGPAPKGPGPNKTLPGAAPPAPRTTNDFQGDIGVVNNFGDNARIDVAGISMPRGRR